jgi:hypothetical protein
VFDTLKALFFSLYGVFVLAALFLGSLWCLFAYGLFGLLYPCSFIVVCVFVLERRERNREAAMAKLDSQVNTETQMAAIDWWAHHNKKHD